VAYKIGVWFSHYHGFGRINAGKAVALAKTWSLIGGVCGTSSDVISVGQTIVNNATSSPVISTITFVNGTDDLPDTIEHVMVYVNIVHQHPNDLRILLISPSGTIAKLALPQTTDPDSSPDLDTYPLAARVFCK
jgi:hypothetical protein